MGEDACKDIQASSGSLDIVSRLSDTPPNSSSQKLPFPTPSYLLLRCPGMDVNYIDFLLLLILFLGITYLFITADKGLAQ